MSIDATDVRDLINNPEGRTPYPEDNKLMLGSAPSGGSSDEYKLKIIESAELGLYGIGLYKNGEEVDNIAGDIVTFDKFTLPWVSRTTTGTPSEHIKPVGSRNLSLHPNLPHAYYFNNTNITHHPDYSKLNDQMKTGTFGVDSNNWSINWKIIKTPMLPMNFNSDNNQYYNGTQSAYEAMVSTVRSKCYTTSNELWFGVKIGNTTNPSEHEVALGQAVTYLGYIINTFVIPNLDNILPECTLSILNDNSNIMALTNGGNTDKVMNLVKPFTFNPREHDLGTYYTGSYLMEALSALRGSINFVIKWDSVNWGNGTYFDSIISHN